MNHLPDPLLFVVVALFIAWPVCFFLIRRETKQTNRWRGWRHLAFLFGPIGAVLIYAGLQLTRKQGKQ
jgi:NhaP-type Na+/H+ or K+/H+ antiporter